MAGFVGEVCLNSDGSGRRLKLVDLGHCEVVQSRSLGAVRVAWTHWAGSSQCSVFEDSHRLLFIEGQTDRLPNSDEPLDRWLENRDGSFRGFLIDREKGSASHPRITLFVDRLATRPIFLLCSPDRICFADKLSNIVANTGGLECNWGGILECAALGSLYSKETSIRNVAMLSPAETVEIQGAAIASRRCNPVALDQGARPDPSAGKRLELAMRKAVDETWCDSQTHLLLSGGLDSRLILGLSSQDRPKTFSLEIYDKESVIAADVAEARGAEFKLLPYPPEHYCGVMQNGYLVTGAMHQSEFVNHIGMSYDWRKRGIPAITHGYFHNTLFRGWTAERWEKYPELSSLGTYMGRKAHYFDRFSCHSPKILDGILTLLSPDGKELLRRQLATLGQSLDVVVIDGYDLTFERLLLNDVGRQVYFGIVHGWIEEIDVVSPVFQRCVWDWYASTHPADRHCDRAMYQVLKTLPFGLADLPDANTGAPVAPLEESRRELFKNKFWFSSAVWIKRHLLDPLRPPPPPKRPNFFHAKFRQKPIVTALLQGIEALKQNPLFDRTRLDDALQEYAAGSENLTDSLWAIAMGGQWARFVANPAVADPFLREAGPADSEKALSADDGVVYGK